MIARVSHSVTHVIYDLSLKVNDNIASCLSACCVIGSTPDIDVCHHLFYQVSFILSKYLSPVLFNVIGILKLKVAPSRRK